MQPLAHRCLWVMCALGASSGELLGRASCSIPQTHMVEGSRLLQRANGLISRDASAPSKGHNPRCCWALPALLGHPATPCTDTHLLHTPVSTPRSQPPTQAEFVAPLVATAHAPGAAAAAHRRLLALPKGHHCPPCLCDSGKSSQASDCRSHTHPFPCSTLHGIAAWNEVDKHTAVQGSWQRPSQGPGGPRPTPASHPHTKGKCM